MKKIHPETGEVLHRDIRPIEYTYKGEKIIINQPAWFNEKCTDWILNSEDWDIADRAYEILKARYEEKISQNNFNLANVAFG